MIWYCMYSTDWLIDFNVVFTQIIESHIRNSLSLTIDITGKADSRDPLIWGAFNSLWPSDAIRGHRTGSTLPQVMAWCHQAPSHDLNQCWLNHQWGLMTITWGQFHMRYINHRSLKLEKNENYLCKISLKSPGDQWVASYTKQNKPAAPNHVERSPSNATGRKVH